MLPDAPPYLATLDAATLTPLVRRALARPTLDVRDGWRVTRLGGGMGNPVSVGLYRVEGIGAAEGDAVPWALVLKLLQSPANVGWRDMGEGDDQSHWNYWRRELLVYRSGLLDALPDGLAAPRCYGSADLPGEIAALWLEPLSDDYAGQWPLERYALAARHLGRLNGRFLVGGAALPDEPWFGRGLARHWVATLPHWRATPWEHPRLLARYGRADNPLRRLLVEPERFLAALDRLPHGLGHGDSFPTNFMSRRRTDGREETVALDWALMAIQPLGDDLAQLLLGARNALPSESGAAINEALFESYLDGLRDEGCHAAPRAVRFGLAAAAALRVGLFQLFLIGEELARGADDMAPTPDDPSRTEHFEAEMAREAYALLDDA